MVVQYLHTYTYIFTSSIYNYLFNRNTRSSKYYNDNNLNLNLSRFTNKQSLADKKYVSIIHVNSKVLLIHIQSLCGWINIQKESEIDIITNEINSIF